MLFSSNGREERNLIAGVRAVEGADNILQPIAVGTSVLVTKLEHLKPNIRMFGREYFGWYQ